MTYETLKGAANLSRHDRLLDMLEQRGFQVAVRFFDNGCASDIDPRVKTGELYEELSRTHGDDRVIMVRGEPVEYTNDSNNVRRPIAPSITTILLSPGTELSDPRFAKNLSI